MNEILKKILLHMNYDSKNTLSENLEKVNLSEGHWGSAIEPKGGNSSYWKNNKKVEIKSYKYNTKSGKNVYINAKTSAGDFKMKYICGGDSVELVEYDGTQWTGTIFNIDSLEKELNSKYCTSKKETDGISQKSTNFVSDEAWQTLYDKLRKKFNVKIGNVRTINQAKTFTIGNFTIHRTGNSFVTLGTKGEENYRVGQIAKEKYKDQELDEFELRVWYVPDTDFMPLWAFLNLQVKPLETKDQGSGGKDPNVKPIKTVRNLGTTSYKNCTETYIKGCKSETIRKVQKCLGIGADGKMGPKTVNTIKTKLGRAYFTDGDVEKLCGAKPEEKKNDSLDLEIPTNVEKKIEEPKPTSDQIEFGGEEF